MLMAEGQTCRNTHALFKPHFTITHWQKQVKVRVKSTAKSSVQCQIQRGVKIQNHTMSHSATQGVTRSVLLSRAGNQRVWSFHLERAPRETGTYKYELNYSLLERLIQRPCGIWWKPRSVGWLFFRLFTGDLLFSLLYLLYLKSSLGVWSDVLQLQPN